MTGPVQPRGRKTALAMVRAQLLCLADRFWTYVHPEPNTGCWLWSGTVSGSGYGIIRRSQTERPKFLMAHRVAYVLERGDLPAGSDLLHSCDCALCVSPWHLRVGTQAENNADMMARGRHVAGNGGGPPKLTPHLVAAMKQLSRDGVTQAQLAREFGVHPKTVFRAVSGRTWRAA